MLRYNSAVLYARPEPDSIREIVLQAMCGKCKRRIRLVRDINSEFIIPNLLCPRPIPNNPGVRQSYLGSRDNPAEKV